MTLPPVVALRRCAVVAIVPLVLLLLAISVVRGRPATAAPAPSLPIGVQFHGIWTNYTDTQRELVLGVLRDAGVTSVRIDIGWTNLQPAGPTYDPYGVGLVDHVITLANAYGMKPLITLWLTPGWANGNAGTRALPSDPADFARVAEWAAAKWRGRVAGWEVWNEENDSGFMMGADPAAYVSLLRAAYPAFKRGDPAAPVVFGGVENNDDGWVARAYDAGAEGYFDVLAIHPYPGRADSAPSTSDDGTKWTIAHVAAVRQVMVGRGDKDKPIWFTEFGWSTHANSAGTANWAMGVSEATQAAYVTQLAALAPVQMPYVTRAYLYTDRDATSGNVQYDNYGVFHSDLSPKPVLRALADANSAVPSPSPSVVPSPSPSVVPVPVRTVVTAAVSVGTGTVSTRVSPARYQRVRIDQWTAGRWRGVRAATVDRLGRVVFRGLRHGVAYRCVVPASAGVAGTVTRTVRVR